MDDTAEDGAEPFVTLKNGPMDGTVIPHHAKDSIVDGLFVGPGPYYPRYRLKPGSGALIAEFEGYSRVTAVPPSKAISWNTATPAHWHSCPNPSACSRPSPV